MTVAEKECARAKKRSWLVYILDLFIAVLVALLVIFMFRLEIIQGMSMSPTLEPGDVTLCMRGNENIEAGDIIVFRTSNNLYYMKRVIALEGQTVRLDPATGDVYVDGILLSDGYAAPRQAEGRNRSEAWPGGYSGAAVTVPEDSFFCLGDNRADSIDSRDASVGMVPQEAVWGKMIWQMPES